MQPWIFEEVSRAVMRRRTIVSRSTIAPLPPFLNPLFSFYLLKLNLSGEYEPVMSDSFARPYVSFQFDPVNRFTGKLFDYPGDDPEELKDLVIQASYIDGAFMRNKCAHPAGPLL